MSQLYSQSQEYSITNNYNFGTNNIYPIDLNNNTTNNNYPNYKEYSYEPISNNYEVGTNNYQNIINNYEENNNINNNIYQENNEIINTNNNNYEINDNNYQINNNNIDLSNNIIYQNDNNNNNHIYINNNQNDPFNQITNEEILYPTQNQEIQDAQFYSNENQNFEQNNQNNIIFENPIDLTEQNNIYNYEQPQENNIHYEINSKSHNKSIHSTNNNINNISNKDINEHNKNNTEEIQEEKEPLIDPKINYSIDQYSEIFRKILENKNIENKELEDTIIKIIEKTDHIQRQQIRMSFYKNYFKNLILIIKKELSGNFKESVLGSFLLPSEYDTYSLYSSFKNANQKKELILSEIIGSRSTSELQTIKKLYISNYRKLLRKDVISQTYGEFQKFILSLLQCQRSTASIPNTNSCANDASDLYQAGEKKRQNDEDTFIRIFTTSSPIELAIINHFYKQQTGKGLLGAIETEFEFSKETKDLLDTIVRSMIDKEGFYAKAIKDAISEGNDAKLIRIICSRHSVDLNEIKNKYKTEYQKDLIEDIKDKKEENWGKIIYSLVDQAK